jgi:hypothetical protein
MAENQIGKRIKRLRTGSSDEYLGDVTPILQSKGIIHSNFYGFADTRGADGQGNSGEIFTYGVNCRLDQCNVSLKHPRILRHDMSSQFGGLGQRFSGRSATNSVFF